MQYECKITVLDTKVFPELQEQYLQTRSPANVRSLVPVTPLCWSIGGDIRNVLESI